MSRYKDISKEFRKKRRQELLDKANLYKKYKNNYLIKTNKAPDVSTITEHIAFVLDGEVVEVIHCQPRMAAILLSSPEIIQISDGEYATIGWKYNGKNFSEPEQPSEPQQQKEIFTDKDQYAVDNGIVTFKEYQEIKKAGSLPSYEEFVNSLKESK
jgi:hypothetical protein